MLQALANLISGRTTFVIAHRMSRVARADKVVVLDGGRIVEQGTHEELIRMRGGLCRSFLELQLVRPAAAAGPLDRARWLRRGAARSAR